jgi:benzoyl-CoA reductase/2-hydroxyglutaryl-CoA dehydratase subunit BcrC/BadD/HgdB
MRPVAYSSPFVPAEWIAAHGFRPKRLVPRAQRSAPVIGTIAGLCPYARAFADEAIADGESAGVVLATTCDQMRRMPDLMALRSDVPLFLMNVPSTWQTAAAQRLYRDELRRLGRFLERLGGTPPGKERLVETMLSYDAARRGLRARRERMSARRFAEACSALDQDGEAAAEPLPALDVRRATRLAVVGGPFLREHFVVYDLIEEAGGQVVLDATEGGERTMPAPFDRRRILDDPLGELADAYFGVIPDAFRRPNDALHAWLKREAADRDVEGIIFHSTAWCDTWEAEGHRLKEWSAVPVLMLSAGDGDGDARSRLARHVHAFLEVVA